MLADGGKLYLKDVSIDRYRKKRIREINMTSSVDNPVKTLSKRPILDSPVNVTDNCESKILVCVEPQVGVNGYLYLMKIRETKLSPPHSISRSRGP